MLAVGAMFSSTAFAQQANQTGFIPYMNNLEGQGLYFVGFFMTIMAIAGVIFGYLAIMTFKDNVSDSPQSGQPEWGKFAGQLVVAAATLGGATWIYSITTAFSGANFQEGAGSKVRERYQSNN